MRVEYVLNMKRSGVGKYNPLSSNIRFMDKKEFMDLVNTVDIRIKAWADKEGLKLVSEDEKIESNTEEEYLGKKEYVFQQDSEIDIRMVYLEMFAVDLIIDVGDGKRSRKAVEELKTYLKALEDKSDYLKVEKRK